MLRIGGFDIISVQTGTFRLDGGAMFGVVPRVLWAPHEDVDEQNRMLLATRTLMAVSQDRKTVVLTDTGTGTKWPVDEAERFDIHYDGEAIERALDERFGLSREDVTDVVATHMHFDHNGGITEWVDAPGGDTKLRFPRARHWMHRRHWEHVHDPTERDRASFLQRDIAALERSDRLSLVEGDAPQAPWQGVRFSVSSGHTPYQLLPVFFDAERELIFTGDVIPTSSHMRVPWVMAYDLEPLKTMEEKRAMHRRCRENGAWLAFPHDWRLAGGEIDFANNRPIVARKLDF